MSKRGNPPRIDQHPPTGPITWADPPRPVRARAKWNYDAEYTIFEDSWAMAWTRFEVYVFLHNNALVGMDTAQLAWLRAEHVMRRPIDGPAHRSTRRTS